MGLSAWGALERVAVAFDSDMAVASLDFGADIGRGDISGGLMGRTGCFCLAIGIPCVFLEDVRELTT